MSEQSAGKRAGNTLEPIVLGPLMDYGQKPFGQFVPALLEKLEAYTRTSFDYYDTRRARNSKWVFGFRNFLALAGAVALLLTAIVTGLQLAPPGEAPWAKYLLVAVLIIYAVMGAIAFYDRATDRASSYFRYVVTILSIRDLWTRLQFEILKEIEKVARATDARTAETAAREQIFVLAQAYCADLNKITSTEATEWRAEFQTSVGQLEEAAKKGTEDLTRRIQEYAKAAEAAAAQAKAAADKMNPGHLNLTVKGNFDGEVTALIDDTEVARSTGRMMVLQNIAVGPRKLTIRANANGKPLEASIAIEVKPGIQGVELAF